MKAFGDSEQGCERPQGGESPNQRFYRSHSGALRCHLTGVDRKRARNLLLNPYGNARASRRGQC
jgi:hypothetical protein